MLMIWSSRARNRSPDPVAPCFFGRIVPSDATTESRFEIRRNRKMKLQGSRPSDPETLQSQNSIRTENRLTINGLAVLHGRLQTCWRSARLGYSTGVVISLGRCVPLDLRRGV